MNSDPLKPNQKREYVVLEERLILKWNGRMMAWSVLGSYIAWNANAAKRMAVLFNGQPTGPFVAVPKTSWNPTRP
jgi:hypothetical protein